jgi:hypothetical protein
MGGRLVTTGAVLVLAITGCGSSGANDSATTRSTQPTTSTTTSTTTTETTVGTTTKTTKAKHAGFTGQAAGTYGDARDVCGAFPPRKVARDLGVHVNGTSTSELRAIADAYASGYRASFRPAAYAGCLAGLRAK